MERLEKGRNYALLIPGVASQYPEHDLADLLETLTLSGAKVIPHFIHGITQVQVIDVTGRPRFAGGAVGEIHMHADAPTGGEVPPALIAQQVGEELRRHRRTGR